MFSLALIVVFVFPPISGQIIEQREYKGETIYCGRSGLRGFSESCGADAGYKYVFIGSVLSVSDLLNDEKRVRLAPEEIFFGNPDKEVVAVTDQGRCLPELQPGRRWLFYLRQDHDANELLLSYGSYSGPVNDEQGRIAVLRRLAQMTNAGLLKGHVSRLVSDSSTKLWVSEPVLNHKITATRKDNRTEYVAFTDSEGDFEFEPLAPGLYQVTSNTDPQWWAWEGATQVRPGNCSYVDFELETNGSISGHVRAGGKTDRIIWVTAAIVGSADSGFKSAPADRDGYFEINGLRPGQYLVGAGIADQTDTPEWKNRVYYPGVRRKDLATVIEIGPAGKRTDIDFSLPLR
jgi:hypothetical protein